MASRKVWLVRMDNAGKYDVAPGIVTRTDGDTVFVRIDVEIETGLADTLVVDVKAKDVYRSEPEAIVAAIIKCQSTAAAYLARATDLARRLQER